jgi:hypothetical protein
MTSEPAYRGREEEERLPAIDSDLENADGNRLSSTPSDNPEKRDDIEVVDWDGPDDPDNPYGQCNTLHARMNLIDMLPDSIGPNHGNGC